MGKGGQDSVRRKVTHESLTWEEVKRHTERNDKWLVIDGEVYDITEWSRRHPGGSKVISHFAGQDASEAFRAFHNDPKFVRKYLKALHIGSLPESEYKQDDIKKDFEELREKVTKLGFFKPSITFFTVCLLHILALEVLAYAVLYYYGTGWIPWLASAVLMGAVQAQAGWNQHDYGHLSVFRQTWLNHAVHQFFIGILKAQVGWNQHDYGHLSVFSQTWLNHIFHQITMCFMKGASGNWWNHLHYQHHAKPNCISKDPDVRLEAVFVVGKEIPKRVAKKGTSPMPFNWQQQYFFAIGPPLLFPLYFQYMTFKHVIVRKKWVDLFSMLCFYVRIAIMYMPLVGVLGFFGWYFAFRVVESHWFVWVSQSNHIPMEIEDDKERPWLALQLHATCDIEKSFFNDWFTGHLNFQIEHHLFPTMPRHNLYKTVPYVKELCAKHNVPYHTKTIGTAFWDIIRSLKSSGEIWHHYYQSYHC